MCAHKTQTPGRMKALDCHQRVIRDWYRAAWQGRRLIVKAPKNAGGIVLLRRIEEIKAGNPRLFRS